VHEFGLIFGHYSFKSNQKIAMKYLKNSVLNSLILFFALSVVISSCTKEDPVLNPRISQLKVCDSAPADKILCANDKGTFAPADPAFYTSAKFEDITKDTDVKFTLSGKDTDGNWVELSTITFKPSQQGTFTDESSFDLSTNFTKEASQSWPVGDYKIDTNIEVTDGPSSSKEFDVQ